MSLLESIYLGWTQLQRIKEETPDEVATGIRLATDLASQNDELVEDEDLAEKLVDLDRILREKENPVQFHQSLKDAYRGTTSDDIETMLTGLQTIHRLPDQIQATEISNDIEASVYDAGNRPVLKIVAPCKREVIPLTPDAPKEVLKTRFTDYCYDIKPVLKDIETRLEEKVAEAKEAGAEVSDATSPYTLLKNL